MHYYYSDEGEEKVKHFSLLVTLLMLLTPLTYAATVSVSPPRIIKENLLVDSSLQEIIVLSKNDNHPVTIEVTLEGQAKDWLTHPSSIEFKENEEKLRVPLDIKVPTNTPLGQYSASIKYIVKGKDNIHAAFAVPITLIVTDKIDTYYQVKHINAKQNQDNIDISFELYNKGNTKSGPSQVILNVLDQTKENILFTQQKDIGTIDAFTFANKDIIFETKLQQGNYWLNIELIGQEQTYSEEIFFEKIDSALNKDTQENDQQTTITQKPKEIIGLSQDSFWVITLIILAFIVSILRSALRGGR